MTTSGQPVSVGPRFGMDWVSLAIGGVVVIGSALWLDQGLPRNKDDYFMPLVGLAFLAAAAFRFLCVRLSWRTVTDTGEGMIVVDRRGIRAYSDELIIQTTLFTREDFQSAKLVSTTRTFDAWVEEQPGAEPRRIRMLNTFVLGGADPLAALIQRLNIRLSDFAREALERGKTVSGERWSIAGTQFTFGSGTRTRCVWLEDITRLRESDGHLCIWIGAEELPRIRCPVNAGNAWLLASLLRERITRESRAGTPPVAGLGRMLFERRPGFLPRLFVWGTLCGLAAAVPAWILGSMMNRAFLIIGAIVAIIAGPVLILAAQPYAKTLRCHEFGVTVSFLATRRMLRFVDVVTYSEKAVAHFGNHGVYEGTVVDLEIVGFAGRRRVEISYATKYYDQDVELENLRDDISRFVAARLQSQLSEQQAVPWTPTLTFLPAGLEFTPTGLLKRPTSELIPYEQINGYDFNSGNLRLYASDAPDRKPKLTIPSSSPNFHPGLALLRTMCPRLRE